jgi:hypothetical protein
METNNLTDQQKAYIESNHKSIPDLIELTRKVFNDDTLDGRTKEGKLVREYLVECGFKYNTTKSKKAKRVNLTEEQKEFIENSARDEMNAFQIACVIWHDRDITPLSKETLVVAEHIKSTKPNLLRSEDSALGDVYMPPQTQTATIKLLNKYCSAEIRQEAISLKQKKYVEQVVKFLSTPRFFQVINSYTDKADRDLFEAEFMRTTWDKPDLTADEINLYINVCIDYINLKNINKAMEKLNRMFHEADDQRDMTVRLAELLKTKSDEYNQCEKRMESLINRLNGDRARRIQGRQEENASILSLVELFQDEKEREIMLKMAQMQKEAVEHEAKHLESMPEWKARVLGISKGDAV